MPTPDEQNAIAGVLANLDAEIKALEQRRAKTTDLKQAMMQELLTGRTRIVSPEVAAADEWHARRTVHVGEHRRYNPQIDLHRLIAAIQFLGDSVQPPWLPTQLPDTAVCSGVTA